MLYAYRNNAFDLVLTALFWLLASDLLANDLSLTDVQVKQVSKYWM